MRDQFGEAEYMQVIPRDTMASRQILRLTLCSQLQMARRLHTWKETVTLKRRWVRRSNLAP